MTPPIVPPERPKLLEVDARRRISKYKVSGAVVLGLRGYYKRTMGDPTKNDFGIYDDAIFLIGPGIFKAFNGNTDPSTHGPTLAVLRCGVYRYKMGIHNWSKPSPPHERYPALVQAGNVTVDRENGKTEVGDFGIHIHKGGFNTTASAGCQTIYPLQWKEFIEAAGRLCDPYIHYILEEA